MACATTELRGERVVRRSANDDTAGCALRIEHEAQVAGDVLGLQELRAVQSDLLLNGEDDAKAGVWPARLGDASDRLDGGGEARPVIGPENRGARRVDHAVGDDRLDVSARLDDVEVGARAPAPRARCPAALR